jgi:hypothetical protein
MKFSSAKASVATLSHVQDQSRFDPVGHHRDFIVIPYF